MPLTVTFSDVALPNHRITAALLLPALTIVLGCSGEGAATEKPGESITTTKQACAVYCDVLLECGPTWALEQRGREDCAWKYGNDTARETCLTSCEFEEVEMYDEEDEMECILCLLDEMGSDCGDLNDALDACPCHFGLEEYGGNLSPAIEPLTCDGGDEYIFSNNEIGPMLREECLSGNTVYCW